MKSSKHNIKELFYDKLLCTVITFYVQGGKISAADNEIAVYYEEQKISQIGLIQRYCECKYT